VRPSGTRTPNPLRSGAAFSGLVAFTGICLLTCANALWLDVGLTRCFARFLDDGRGVNRGLFRLSGRHPSGPALGVERKEACGDAKPRITVSEMKKLGVATWNLNARNFETWERLTQLAPQVDIVLVQEARPPLSRWKVPTGVVSSPPFDEYEAHKTPNNWFPSAVVLLNPALRLEPREDLNQASHRGTLAVADVYEGDSYLLTVASAYGMFEPAEGFYSGASELSMTRIIDDLEALVADGRQPLVLGGDFNVWGQGDAYAPYRAVLDRLASIGLVDCLYVGVGEPRIPLVGCPCGRGIECNHVRTLRGNRKDDLGVPYQNDYLYASRQLAPQRLVECHVIDSEDVWQFSDHCVVFASFELEQQLASVAPSA
jgi:exonuclease III